MIGIGYSDHNRVGIWSSHDTAGIGAPHESLDISAITTWKLNKLCTVSCMSRNHFVMEHTDENYIHCSSPLACVIAFTHVLYWNFRSKLAIGMSNMKFLTHVHVYTC